MLCPLNGWSSLDWRLQERVLLLYQVRFLPSLLAVGGHMVRKAIHHEVQTLSSPLGYHGSTVWLLHFCKDLSVVHIHCSLTETRALDRWLEVECLSRWTNRKSLQRLFDLSQFSTYPLPYRKAIGGWQVVIKSSWRMASFQIVEVQKWLRIWPID